MKHETSYPLLQQKLTTHYNDFPAFITPGTIAYLTVKQELVMSFTLYILTLRPVVVNEMEVNHQ